MFSKENHYNYNYNYNITYDGSEICNKEENRLIEYNNNLNLICYYYIGCVNFLLLISFLYDLRKNYCAYYKNSDIPRVLSSPKYLSSAISMEIGPEFIDTEFIDIESIFNQECDKEKKGIFIVFYWNNSLFIAKMCETIQLIILLGIFEYLFFTYLFNKFKIITAKMILCKLLN